MYLSRFIIAAIILASFGPIIRFLADYFSLVAQISLRILAAFLIALTIQVVQRTPKAVSGWRLSPKWTLIYSTAFPLSVAAFTFSVTTTTIAISIFGLFAGSIATTTIISLLKSDQTEHWYSALLSIAGLLVVAVPELRESTNSIESLVGPLSALVAGILDGFANQARRRLANAPVNELLIYQFGTGLVLAFLALLLVETGPVKAWSSWSLLIALSSGALVYGVGAIVHGGYRHVSSRIGAQILALEIPFAIALAWVFLGERLTVPTVLGGLLVFAGAAVATPKSPIATGSTNEKGSKAQQPTNAAVYPDKTRQYTKPKDNQEGN